MRLRFEPRVLDLLQGAIDMHIHSAPDVYPRILSDLDLARQAQEMGMRAVVVKNHFASTAGRAWLASDETGFPVFGSIALNHTVGGLNPHAVDFALRMGARVIWLPTLHAQQFLENKSHVRLLAGSLGEDLQGIRILDDDGELKAEIHAILDLVARRDVILATGHISIEEARAVVPEATRCGISRIVVTHPLASFLNYSLDEMKEILDLGATYLEHVYNDTTHHGGYPLTIDDLAGAIKAMGASHCIMSTDSGQLLNPPPVQQFGIFMQEMLSAGLSEKEIRTMTAGNPAQALGI
jgi:hypothetical protein